MPVSDLNPYQPSPDFQQRLQQHGLHWDSPATLTPCRNEVAHQLLPQQKTGFSLARLMSVLMLFVGLFLWAPTLWAAEVIHISYSGFSLLDLIPFLLVMQAIVLVLLLLMILSKQLTMATPATPSRSSLPTTPNRAPTLSTDNTPLCPIARIPQASSGASVGLLLAAATRQGLVRTDNQDACISHQLTPEQGILIVCDGVGGHPGGAEASTHATDYLLRCLSIQLRVHSASQRLLHTALLLTQQYFAEQQFVGLTTALIVVIENDQLYYATLGDGDIVVIHPDGMVQSLQAPHHALGQPNNMITAYLSATEQFVPRLGSLTLEAGSLVMAMSDGVSDLIPLDGLAAQRDTYLQIASTRGVGFIVDQILDSIESARDEETDALLHSDNMTLGMAVTEQEGRS